MAHQRATLARLAAHGALSGISGTLITVAATSTVVYAIGSGDGIEAPVAKILGSGANGLATMAAAATGAQVNWTWLGVNGEIWPAQLLWSGSPLALAVVGPLLAALCIGWRAMSARARALDHLEQLRRLGVAGAAYALLMAAIAVAGPILPGTQFAEVRTQPLLVAVCAYLWVMVVGVAAMALRATAGEWLETRRRRLGAILATGGLLVMSIAGPAAATPGEQPNMHRRSGVAEAIESLRVEAGAPPVVNIDTTRGVPSTVLTSSPLGAGALPWLVRHKGLLSIADPQSQLRVLRSQTDQLSQRHEWYQQVVGGVPVYGARLAVHSNGKTVHTLTNGTYPDLAVASTSPTLSAEHAVEAALRAIPGGRLVQPADLYLLPSTLSQPGSVAATGPTPAALVWRVWLTNAPTSPKARSSSPKTTRGNAGTSGGVGTATGEPAGHEVEPHSTAYFVDARSTGRILTTLPMSVPAKDRSVSDWKYSTEPPAAPTRTEGDAATGILDVDHAYTYAGETYDFYHSGRVGVSLDSYDDAGATMTMNVNVREELGEAWGNAYWDGKSATFFGEGMTARDVVAHEWTHAVTQHSADLLYQFESGALNESFSDVMGESVEYYATGGEADWLIGEETLRGSLRSMSDPSVFGDPGHMDDYLSTCADHGGVHHNSGIPNKAYYTLVQSIGVDKAVKIFFRDLITYLAPNSIFADARNGAIQAAYDLFGKQSTEAQQTVQAWSSVGVTDMTVTPPKNCGCFSNASLTGSGPAGMDPAGSSVDQVAAALLRTKDLFELAGSPATDHYAHVYARANSQALALLLADDALRQQTAHALQSFEPALHSVDTSEGDQVIISQAVVNELLNLMDAYIASDRDHGTGELALLLEAERSRIDPAALPGLTVNQAQAYLDSLFA